MPIIQKSTYKPPLYLFNNGDLQTIIPSLFRKINGVNYERERISTPDNDFLDLDWSKIGAKKLVIVSHGLEGSTDRHYVRGTIKIFNQYGWDGLGINYRTCSGEMNSLPRFYHHGDTPDLELVINHAIENHHYQKIVLVGFSMGGSITLKYLGERGKQIPKEIFKAFAVSVPCHLRDTSLQMEKRRNWLYNENFMRKISKKLKVKAEQYPQVIRYQEFKTFREFDDFYTAPLHGYLGVEDFYNRAASLPHLQDIAIPAYILSATNDSFLTERCFPFDLAKKSKLLHLEITKQGGHVGFTQSTKEATYAEQRAVEWASEQ